MTDVLPRRTLVARPAGPRPAPWAALAVGLLLLGVVGAASLLLGARAVAPADVLAALLAADPGSADHAVVVDQRLPRTLVGLAAGAALGAAGAVMQGLTRNPLADPGLLGVNAGASLGVVLAISVLGLTAPTTYVWFALAGAAGAALLVHAVGALARAGSTPVTLALAGTALTAAATSVIALLLILESDTLNSYRRWSVGSLAGRDAGAVADLAPFLLLGAGLALAAARTLDLLALGEDLARGLGAHLTRGRGLALVAIVLLAGSATALAGPIVFVGLVVPHLVRRVTGPRHGWLVGLSLVAGAALLVAADVVGRLLARPGELEAGVVVALVGAPVLVAVVRRPGAVGP